MPSRHLTTFSGLVPMPSCPRWTMVQWKVCVIWIKMVLAQLAVWAHFELCLKLSTTMTPMTWVLSNQADHLDVTVDLGKALYNLKVCMKLYWKQCASRQIKPSQPLLVGGALTPFWQPFLNFVQYSLVKDVIWCSESTCYVDLNGIGTTGCLTTLSTSL